METIIFIAIIGVLVAIVVWLVIRQSSQKSGNTEGMVFIQNQLNEVVKTLDNKLGESTKVIDARMGESAKLLQAQFGESAKIIQSVTEKLTKLDETNRQVVSFADQLKNLQDILKNPKQRGVLGEYYLETLLKNVLPPGSYEMQYRLGKDEEGHDLIPDAVIFVKNRIIPVDSKFSLENYNRISETPEPLEKERLEKVFLNDLKNRIVETSKYIQPSKKTMEFAFMFIPHEAIYYDLLVNKVGALNDETENLIQRAASKYKVIIVSPTSFLAYLQTVLQGLKALEIEENAQDIIKRVGELGKHLKSYEEYHNKLGNSLSTVVNHYNSSGKELKKIDKDVVKISATGGAVDPVLIEKPIAHQDIE